MTGRDLVTASLRLIGVLASGEAADSDEATDGLATLNRMVSAWSTEGLLIYSKVREELTLVAGTQSYTMGSSGDLNTTRPLKIEAAAIELQSTSPAQEVPVKVITFQEWAAIRTRAISMSIPTHLYPDYANPLVTLNLYGNPSVAEHLVLYSWKSLTSISTLDTSLAFPPGYEEALVFNGAIRLAPEYSKSTRPEIVEIAKESKATIKRLNSKPYFLDCDSALMGGGGGFNIYTGDYRS